MGNYPRFFGKDASNLEPEPVVYNEYLTAVCCREWPHMPGMSYGSCGICRKRPRIENRPYIKRS